MKKELICIRCPMGCHLLAEWNGSMEELKVTGNRCPRGAAYASQELRDPQRTVTAVVRSNSARHPYLPVRTSRELPKSLIAPLLDQLYSMTVPLPVRRGEILLADFMGSAVDVVFSSTALE